MKRGEIAGRAIFDFQNHIYNKDVEEYKTGITEFIRENKDLSDDAFFKKFEEQFGLINVLHKTYSRMYLAKIASGINTIKVIAVIYLIASIIGGIALAVQLTP